MCIRIVYACTCKVIVSGKIIGVGLVCSFKLDLDKKVCTSYGAVDRASVEFPTTHPYRHGMEGTRYSYLMASDRKNCNLPYRDVVKVWLKPHNTFTVYYSDKCNLTITKTMGLILITRFSIISEAAPADVF